jgi:hypothetical protein
MPLVPPDVPSSGVAVVVAQADSGNPRTIIRAQRSAGPRRDMLAPIFKIRALLRMQRSTQYVE